MSSFEKKLYVCFLPADSSLLEDHYLNKLAAFTAPKGSGPAPMIHTELMFVDGETSGEVLGEACSIHYNGKVFLADKRFSRDSWTFRQVQCSQQDIEKAYDYCKLNVGKPFNKVAYYTTPFCSPHHLPFTHDRFFCSQIVGNALLCANVDVVPDQHPHALYQSLLPVTTPCCPKGLGQMKF